MSGIFLMLAATESVTKISQALAVSSPNLLAAFTFKRSHFQLALGRQSPASDGDTWLQSGKQYCVAD